MKWCFSTMKFFSSFRENLFLFPDRMKKKALKVLCKKPKNSGENDAVPVKNLVVSALICLIRTKDLTKFPQMR